MPSGNRNVARIRHDRTLAIAFGLWGSHGKKERGLRFCCVFRYLNAVREGHTKNVTFEDQQKEGEEVDRSLKQGNLSGQTNGEERARVQDQHPG